jgi:hypothetical protein
MRSRGEIAALWPAAFIVAVAPARAQDQQPPLDPGRNTAQAAAQTYPFNSRNVRLNLQVIEVQSSPVDSLFGFYVGGQRGTTVSGAFSFLF